MEWENALGRLNFQKSGFLTHPSFHLRSWRKLPLPFCFRFRFCFLGQICKTSLRWILNFFFPNNIFWGWVISYLNVRCFGGKKIFLGKWSHQKELLREYCTPFCTPMEGHSEFICYLHSNLCQPKYCFRFRKGSKDLKASLLLPLPLKKSASHCFRFRFCFCFHITDFYWINFLNIASFLVICCF